jgi:hypothetical protein
VSDDAGQKSIEEELAAGVSTPVRRVLVIAVVLIAAVAVPLTVVIDRSRSGPRASRSTPSPASGVSALSAADALVPGLATSNGLGPRLVYTVELGNATGAALTVHYPIRVSRARSSPATLSYVDVTAAGGLIHFDSASRRLDHIPAHGKSTLQLGLRVRCNFLPTRPSWPSGDSTITIPLAGYPTPAVFTFAGLFGFDIGADLRNACRRPAGFGDR